MEITIPEILKMWHDITPEEFDEIHMAVFQADPATLRMAEQLLQDGEVSLLTAFLGGAMLGKRLAEKKAEHPRHRGFCCIHKPEPPPKYPRGYRGSIQP